MKSYNILQTVKINQISPSEDKRLKEEAKRILSHQFEILSRKIKFGKKINWHSNFSKESWPREPYLEFRKNNYNFDSKKYIGDIKLPWELNKHLYLQDLTKAYLVSKDEKYTQEFINQLTDWLEENPYEIGLNWSEGLIASHRAISWMIALSGFKSSSLLTSEFIKKIHSSLFEHSIFIEKTYEFCARASNHLLGELCAQIVLSVVFPEFDGSRKRLDNAIKNLEAELKLQVYSDGVDYEMSLSYQRVILEFLYLPLILSKRKLIKLPKSIWSTAEKMTEFMMHMTQPNGYLQPISDADGARVFVLGNDINDFRPHLALGAWLFNRGDFKFVSDNHFDEIKWFLMPDECIQFENIEAIEPDNKSMAFREGGYWILRNGWSKDSDWLFFDCGYMGMGEWPEDLLVGVHGHSDTLNFGLCVGGETFLTDNGSYSYTTERQLHQYFRSSRAHNVAIIDDKDQNVIENKPWLAFQHALPQNSCHYFSNKVGYVAGEHTGYLRFASGLVHRREIMFFYNENFFILKDSFLGKGQHKIDELFHSSPKLKIKKIKNGFYMRGKKKELLIKSLFEAELCSVSGKNNPPEGWYAPTFGKKEKSTVVKFNFLISPSSEKYFLFSWGKTVPDKDKIIDLFEKTLDSIRKPRIVMLATNDLVNDPRVQKQAESAALNGFDTLAIGFSILTPQEKITSSNYRVTNIVYQPWRPLKKVSHFIGRKIMAIYYKVQYFPRVLALFGGLKNILRSGTLSLIDSEINQPTEVIVANPVSQSVLVEKTETYPSLPVLVFKAVHYFFNLNQQFIREAIEFKPDIIHANDLDTLLAGYIIKKKTGAKLIYDSHELWTKQGMAIPGIFIKAMGFLEKKLLEKIDAFVSVNQSIIDELEKIYAQQINTPKLVVYNAPQMVKLKPSKINKNIIVVYQGRFAPNRGLENLVMAVRYFKPNVKLYFRCTGEEDIKQKIIQLVKKNKLDKKIIFLDPVGMKEMSRAASFADIGIIPYLPLNRNNELATPNKLFEYSMAGLAICASNLPEMAKFVKTYQNGILFNPRSQKSIAQAVNGLAGNQKILMKMKENSLLAAKEFNWENQSKKLVSLYKTLIKKECNHE